MEVRILDDAGAELPDGSDGNISVRSGMVSNGYLWGDDGQALRCFDGWYTVGDQGYLADGTLHILGRRSDMIITAGKNVYPHEVELALASVPGVASAVAAGMADDLRGQKVVAGVVPSHGGVTATQLKAGLEDMLARDKRPLQYFALAELPLTDRGKVSRQLLLDWIAAQRPAGSGALAERQRAVRCGCRPSGGPAAGDHRRPAHARSAGPTAHSKHLRAHELLAPVLRCPARRRRRGAGGRWPTW